MYMTKVMFCLSVIFMAASPLCMQIPALPTSEYADTEFSLIAADCEELFALLTAIVKTSRRER